MSAQLNEDIGESRNYDELDYSSEIKGLDLDDESRESFDKVMALLERQD